MTNNHDDEAMTSYSTPPIRARYSSSSLSQTPETPSAHLRTRALAQGRRLPPPPSSSVARSRGTPLGRVLAQEGITPKSPRRIRKRSWKEKAQDWPSNLLLSLETSLSTLSIDAYGYPIAISLHAVHALTRLSVLTSKLPEWFANQKQGSVWGKRPTDADARLEALRRAGKQSARWGWRLATTISILLVLVSCANALYLFTRRRKYHLFLRRDPLASPNARTATVDFSPTRAPPSITTRAKDWLYSRLPWPFGRKHIEENGPRTFEIQELDVWTPEYNQWSLKIFAAYSPPVALMYHFLSASNFVPFLVIGALLTFQILLLVYTYSHLVKDRATLQSEVMHEYDAKFVKPRLFMQKRDVGVDTDELALLQARSIRRSRSQHQSIEDFGEETPLEAEMIAEYASPREARELERMDGRRRKSAIWEGERERKIEAEHRRNRLGTEEEA